MRAVSGAEFWVCDDEGAEKQSRKESGCGSRCPEETLREAREKTTTHIPKLTSTDFQITICPTICQEVAIPEGCSYDSRGEVAASLSLTPAPWDFHDLYNAAYNLPGKGEDCPVTPTK